MNRVKKIGKKLVLFLILPALALIVFLSLSGSSLSDFLRSVGIDKLAVNIPGAPSAYTPQEVLAAGDRLSGKKIKVTGTIHFLFRNPDHIGSYYSIGSLQLKVPSAQSGRWSDAVNTEKTVEGTLTAMSVPDSVTRESTVLYYLDEPTILD